MSWDEMDVIVKTSPNCKASVAINNDLIARVNLSFSDSFYQSVGRPECCDVFEGKDDNAGSLKIVIRPGGKHKFRDLVKGGARLQVRAPLCVPNHDREQEAAKTTDASPAGFIIVLPILEWERQGKAPAQPVKQETKPAATNGHATAEKINVVAYLTSKGRECRKTGSGWLIDGDAESRAGALVVVNRFRRAQGLQPVGMADIE